MCTIDDCVDLSVLSEEVLVHTRGGSAISTGQSKRCGSWLLENSQ